LDDSAHIHGAQAVKKAAGATLSIDNGTTHFLSKLQEQKTINQNLAEKDLLLLPEGSVKSTEAALEKALGIAKLEKVAILDRDLPPPEPLLVPTLKTDMGSPNNDHPQVPKETENEKQSTEGGIDAEKAQPKENEKDSGEDKYQDKEKGKEQDNDKNKDKEEDKGKEKEKEKERTKDKEKEKVKVKDKEKSKERTTVHKLALKNKAHFNSVGRNSKLRSNSPKPVKTSKLVTEEATEYSLSIEEARRIAGMRILLAEDNLIAQKVLSKQLELFGLVISCANDGADALALFKDHPRGYYTLGFFDHHMPNCKAPCFVLHVWQSVE
jgi:CheY-like chemotaxis protein